MLTEGKPLGRILTFSVPLMVGSVFQQLLNIVDTMVVGKLIGKDALAAVGSTGSLLFMVIGFMTGLCSGLSIPAAKFFGAKDFGNMRKSVSNAIYIGAALTAAITAATLICTDGILTLIGTPANIYADSYRYIIVIFAGMATTFLYNLLSSFLYAIGDSSAPLCFLSVGVVVNTLGDVLLIAVCRTGVIGAAIATVASQLVSGLLCLFYILGKYKSYVPRGADWTLSPVISKQLAMSGIPMGLQFSITGIGAIILQKAVNSLGSDAVAAVSCANKIQGFVFAPMESVGLTLATYCSQNLGAGKIKRISDGVKQSFLAEIAYCLVFGTLIFFFGGNVAYLFVDLKETELVANVALFMQINAVFYITLSVIYIYRNSLQGLGFSVSAVCAGILELVGRTAIGLVFVGIFGYTAVCFASPLAWVLADALLIPLFYYKVHRLLKNPK